MNIDELSIEQLMKLKERLLHQIKIIDKTIREYDTSRTIQSDQRLNGKGADGEKQAVRQLGAKSNPSVQHKEQSRTAG
jgi:hypothetical protein